MEGEDESTPLMNGHHKKTKEEREIALGVFDGVGGDTKEIEKTPASGKQVGSERTMGGIRQDLLQTRHRVVALRPP